MKTLFLVFLLSIATAHSGEEEINPQYLALWVLNFERAESVVIYRWEKGEEENSVIYVEYGYPKGDETPLAGKRKSTTKFHAVGDFEIVFSPSIESVTPEGSIIPSVVLTKESKPLVDSFLKWCKAIGKKKGGLIYMGKSSFKAPGSRGK